MRRFWVSAEMVVVLRIEGDDVRIGARGDRALVGTDVSGRRAHGRARPLACAV
jgi:hypothetical protein